MLSAAVCAVNSEPSEQVMPSLRVRVTVVPSTFQSFASCDADLTVRVDADEVVVGELADSWNRALTADICGSRAPGSATIEKVKVPSSTKSELDDELPLAPAQPARAVTATAVARTARAGLANEFMQVSFL